MAQKIADSFLASKDITIILVRPQMGENIGSIARVMLNFGLTKLRIISPRDGWPNEKAKMLSVGASSVLANAQIYDDFTSAIADLEFIYAATARPRFLNKEAFSPESFASEIKHLEISAKIGILMGPESSGLSNEEIVAANKIVTIPVNPEFSSINIAQATGIICYELGKLENIPVPPISHGALAVQGEIVGLYQHLEEELDSRNYFKTLEKREGMINNLRNMFKRIDHFTSQDVRTFRGIIRCLTEFRKKG